MHAATVRRHHFTSDRDRAEAMARIRIAAEVVHDRRPPDSLLTAAEVALMTGISTATLASWRCRGTSKIPFLKVAGGIRYELNEVLAYLDAARVPARSDK